MKYILHDTYHPELALECAKKLEVDKHEQCIYAFKVNGDEVLFYARKNRASISVQEVEGSKR